MARWWSLSILAPGDEAGPTSGEERQGLMSSQIVFEADRSYRVAVARELRPGNWLQAPEGDELVLLLRLYSPDTDVLRRPVAADLPSIERQVCR